MAQPLLSTRGWLLRGPTGRRMTKRQKDMVVRAVHAAMDLAGKSGAEECCEYKAECRECRARKAVVAALEAYPCDRSCATCDYFVEASRHCIHWNQVVPQEAVDAGCDRWQDDGAPF